MLAHMKMRHTEHEAEIMLTVPVNEASRVSDAILGMLTLAGHKVRRLNDEKEVCHACQ
jgi:hypothetical protein